MSKRRTKLIKRKILGFLLPPIFNLIMRLISLTCTKKFIIDTSSDIDSSPIIFTFWHGEIFMQPFAYKRIRPKKQIKMIISNHFDGNIIAKAISFFGFGTVRGSSRDGAISVLKNSLKAIDSGYDLGITPDGPKGPAKSVANGIVAISKKKDLFIVASTFKCSRYWKLKSWDSFVIPKPFSKVTIHIKKEFKLTNLNKEESINKIKNIME